MKSVEYLTKDKNKKQSVREAIFQINSEEDKSAKMKI